MIFDKQLQDFEEGKYYQEINGTLFKLHRDDIYNSADGINWRCSREIFTTGYLLKESFTEVQLNVKIIPVVSNYEDSLQKLKENTVTIHYNIEEKTKKSTTKKKTKKKATKKKKKT